MVHAASVQELKCCSTYLSELDFPELPGDYVDFLKTSNGYEFNSVEFFGTDIFTAAKSDYQLLDLVTATQDFNEEFAEYLNLGYDLLCIGQKNGDYLTYDPETHRYQVRSHESACTTVWAEYNSFGELFLKEA